MSDSQKFWDKVATRYENSTVSDEAAYQQKLAETQNYFRSDMRIAEFGCGTGTTAIHHAPHVQHIDATDISENMIEIGRTKARNAGISNITFTRGTLVDLNFADANFDAVLGLNVIHLLPDRNTVLAEVARVLQPGGIFVSSTVCLGDSHLRLIALVAPLAKMLNLMPDFFVLTQADLTGEITEAGFEIKRQWQHGKSAITTFVVARKI